ncbi:hypothetical protein [Actinoallomurus rhizosphaericola]|uniref:hypothetical protein n=1 Tax=Actinoallomurus rhizosphaericola TaxID=2952536 RepID=UPI002093E8DB|nr:hypothetical protein [Actinoallomurus rhizosphaericola]MCO5999349.1 hypothetical protein [Actinoallomurus rhizosphaericola]
MKLIGKGRVVGAAATSAAAIALLTGAAAPANATPPGPAACTAWQNISAATSGSDTVWLQYNSGCRTVRAVMSNWSTSSGWEIWVYNEDTGATASAYNPHVVTDTISDAGTRSHACVQQSGRAKSCTPYF